MNVPISRLQPSQGFSLGRSTEITRDEIKFNKFVQRLRKKFSELFAEALRIQLIAKGIIRVDEWDEIYQDIRFDYQMDNHFSELKNNEIIQQRINALQLIDPYVGRYYSQAFIRKNILMQDEQEIKDIDKEMNAEKALIIAQAKTQAQVNTIIQGEPQ